MSLSFSGCFKRLALLSMIFVSAGFAQPGGVEEAPPGRAVDDQPNLYRFKISAQAAPSFILGGVQADIANESLQPRPQSLSGGFLGGDVSVFFSRIFGLKAGVYYNSTQAIVAGYNPLGLYENLVISAGPNLRFAFNPVSDSQAFFHLFGGPNLDIWDFHGDLKSLVGGIQTGGKAVGIGGRVGLELEFVFSRFFSASFGLTGTFQMPFFPGASKPVDGWHLSIPLTVGICF